MPRSVRRNDFPNTAEGERLYVHALGALRDRLAQSAANREANEATLRQHETSNRARGMFSFSDREEFTSDLTIEGCHVRQRMEYSHEQRAVLWQAFTVRAPDDNRDQHTVTLRILDSLIAEDMAEVRRLRADALARLAEVILRAEAVEHPEDDEVYDVPARLDVRTDPDAIAMGRYLKIMLNGDLVMGVVAYDLVAQTVTLLGNGSGHTVLNARRHSIDDIGTHKRSGRLVVKFANRAAARGCREQYPSCWSAVEWDAVQQPPAVYYETYETTHGSNLNITLAVPQVVSYEVETTYGQAPSGEAMQVNRYTIPITAEST